MSNGINKLLKLTILLLGMQLLLHIFRFMFFIYKHALTYLVIRDMLAIKNINLKICFNFVETFHPFSC